MPTTLDKTLEIWSLKAYRIAAITRVTNTSTPTNEATRLTDTPTAEPPAPPAFAGTQPVPVHRHRPSGECAGFHSAPSHHQKPSAEKRARGGGGGDSSCGPIIAPSIESPVPDP